MSARLVKQIAELSKKQNRDTTPVTIYLRSGRTIEGELGTIDGPNGTVEIHVAGGWKALVATEAIEAVSRNWPEMAA